MEADAKLDEAVKEIVTAIIELMQWARDNADPLESMRSELEAQCRNRIQPFVGQMEQKLDETMNGVLEVVASALEKHDVLSGAYAASILRDCKEGEPK